MSEGNYDKDFFDPGINETKEKCKKKIDNLKILYEHGFKEEALTLCCLYIENLTKIFKITDEKNNSGRMFCKALLNYSQIDIFKKIKLFRMLSKMKEKDNIREKILECLKGLGYKIAQGSNGRKIFVDYKNGGSDYPELVFDNKASIEKFLSEKIELSPQEISKLELDSGTIANELYECLRCNAVHQGIVEIPRFAGVPLDFPMLYKALNNIFESGVMERGKKELCEALNQ